MRAYVHPIFAGLLLSVLAAWGQGDPPPAPVEVAEVVEEDVARTVDLVGQVEARRRSTVAAQTEGAVARLLVEEGDAVADGAPLAELDTVALAIEIETAEAAKAELVSRQEDARQRYERSQKLFEKGRISEEEYEDDLHAADALKHLVARADAQVRQLQDRRQRAVIRAPFAGVVAEKRIEVGEWLDQGEPVVDVLELSPVRVRVDLPDQYLGVMAGEAPVGVSVDALAGRTFQGRVAVVVPDADPRAHTVPIKIEVANPDGALHAGMFARASLPLQWTEKALLVPKDAVVSGNPSSHVFVVREGAAVMVRVDRLGDAGSRAVVRGELQPGEQVVVRGNERLRPGQPVRIAGQGVEAEQGD